MRTILEIEKQYRARAGYRTVHLSYPTTLIFLSRTLGVRGRREIVSDELSLNFLGGERQSGQSHSLAACPRFAAAADEATTASTTAFRSAPWRARMPRTIPARLVTWSDSDAFSSNISPIEVATASTRGRGGCIQSIGCMASATRRFRSTWARWAAE